MLLYRPPRGAEKRLTVNAQGKFVCLLKVPCRDATTRIVFEPSDLIARLAALVPRPRVSLSRNHEVSAPKHRWRAEVTPAGRGRGGVNTARFRACGVTLAARRRRRSPESAQPGMCCGSGWREADWNQAGRG
jgi:hypothetical protein